jgi:hypothetical protein
MPATTTRYVVIGAGQTADHMTRTSALAHADQLSAAGWYVGVVETATNQIIAELGAMNRWPADKN